MKKINEIKEWKMDKVQCGYCKIGNKLTKKQIIEKKKNNIKISKGWKCKICGEFNIIKDYQIRDNIFIEGKKLYFKKPTKMFMKINNPFSENYYKDVEVNVEYLIVQDTTLLSEGTVLCKAFGNYKHKIKDWMFFLKPKTIKEELHKNVSINKNNLTENK